MSKKKNRKIVEKVNEAFQNNQPAVFLSYCDDEVVWRMVGDREFIGKDAIREFMSSMEGMDPPRFEVDEIIASRKSVCCYGDMTMKDEAGNEGKYSYVDVYHFADDKITKLQSFIVKHKTEGKGSESASA